MNLFWRITALFAILLITACSANDISGTYSSESNPHRVLRLTKDKKFLVGGDAGEYSVEGKKVLLIHLMGGAEGTLEGGKIIFPKASPRNIVGHDLEGVWVKQ